MDDALEDPPLLGVGEDDLAHGRPVELAFLGEHVGAEGLHDLPQPVGARSHDLPREHVGVDDHCAQLVEDRGHVLLPEATPPVRPTRLTGGRPVHSSPTAL